jgi:hypothetical protein
MTEYRLIDGRMAEICDWQPNTTTVYAAVVAAAGHGDLAPSQVEAQLFAEHVRRCAFGRRHHIWQPWDED